MVGVVGVVGAEVEDRGCHVAACNLRPASGGQQENDQAEQLAADFLFVSALAGEGEERSEGKQEGREDRGRMLCPKVVRLNAG